MQYRNNKKGEPISALGYGCMRFSKKGRSIDIDKTREEILEAYRQGVNYFDTAYMYSGSEAVLGQILEETGIRADVNIATKLPQYMVGSLASAEKIFQEELSRLRTDWIDYYLMHMITDVAQWTSLKKMGIEDWIAEKKASGAIRNIGFSFHGNTESFLKVLEDYDWDFCMIQYNYMDEDTQAGREGLMAAAEKGIPVIIMEPLRGGHLVNMLPAEAKKLISDSEAGYSPAELALRWLWDQPQVTCILSGMNSMEMVRENCRIAADALPGAFDEDMQRLVADVRDSILQSTKVGCTGCGYCMPCPQNVDIPGTFRSYNRIYSEKRTTGMRDYFQTIGLRDPAAFAWQCNGCGRCERHCPQHLEIRKELKRARRTLTPAPIRGVLWGVRKYMKIGKKER